MDPLSYRHWICEGLRAFKTIQKTQWNILEAKYTRVSRFFLPCGSLRRSTSANRATLSACALGTFSHTSCFRIDCTLAGLSLRQLSSGQRQPIMRRASRLHSWDVFAYDLLPNRLRLLDRSAESLHSIPSKLYRRLNGTF